MNLFKKIDIIIQGGLYPGTITYAESLRAVFCFCPNTEKEMINKKNSILFAKGKRLSV